VRSENSQNFSVHPYIGRIVHAVFFAIAQLSGLLIIIGCGELGKVILQVSITVFQGTVKIFFRQKWLSPPP